MARTKGSKDAKKRKQRDYQPEVDARKAQKEAATAAAAAANRAAFAAALQGVQLRDGPQDAANASDSNQPTSSSAAGPSGVTRGDADDPLNSHAASEMSEELPAAAGPAAAAAAAADDGETPAPVDRETIEERILVDEALLHDVHDGETLDGAAPPSHQNKEFFEAVKARLVEEYSGKTLDALASPWLLNHLKGNEWWIRACHAPEIAKKLGVEFTELEALYFRDLYYWEPTKRYGCKMSCPTPPAWRHRH